MLALVVGGLGFASRSWYMTKEKRKKEKNGEFGAANYGVASSSISFELYVILLLSVRAPLHPCSMATYHTLTYYTLNMTQSPLTVDWFGTLERRLREHACVLAVHLPKMYIRYAQHHAVAIDGPLF